MPWVGLGSAEGAVYVLACAGPRSPPLLREDAVALARRAFKGGDAALVAWLADHVDAPVALAAMTGLPALERTMHATDAWPRLLARMRDGFSAEHYWTRAFDAPTQELLGSSRLDARAAAAVRLAASVVPTAQFASALASNPRGLAAHVVVGCDRAGELAGALAEALCKAVGAFASTWRMAGGGSEDDAAARGREAARDCAPVLWALQRACGGRADDLDVIQAACAWTLQVEGVPWADQKCAAIAQAIVDGADVPATAAKRLRARLAKAAWERDPVGCFALLALCTRGKPDADWLPPLLALADDYQPAVSAAAWGRIAECVEAGRVEELRVLLPSVERGLCSRNDRVVARVCACARQLVASDVGVDAIFNRAVQDARYAASAHPGVYVSLARLVLVPALAALDLRAVRQTRWLLEAVSQGVAVSQAREAALELFRAVLLACEPRIAAHRDVCLSIALRAALVGCDVVAEIRQIEALANDAAWWAGAAARVRARGPEVLWRAMQQM